MPTRISPMMVKKKPVGTRRSSMSGEPEVQKQKQAPNGNGQRHRTQVPAYPFIVLQLRETVYQAVQFLLRPGVGEQADHDGDRKAGGPRRNRDPEVLRHGGGELVEAAEPPALAF